MRVHSASMGMALVARTMLIAAAVGQSTAFFLTPLRLPRVFIAGGRMRMQRSGYARRVTLCALEQEAGSQSDRRIELRDFQSDRRSALRFFQLLGLSVMRGELVQASDDPVAQIRKARELLGTIPPMIEKEQWDKCRTVVNTPPLGFTGAGSLSGNLGVAAGTLTGGLKGAAKGIAQDTLTSVKLLDSFCYTNVFVDESRQVLGVPIDKKTPLSYLATSQANLDQFLELFGDEPEEEN